MKLKNKYSKQILYSNQKFEDQIWYNQQIMTFLNFSQLPESIFRSNFSGKHFPENQVKFFFDSKVFPVINLSNGKQTQESLKNSFPETTFQKINKAKRKNIFLEIKSKFFFTGKCFPLTRKCFLLTKKYFPLTNFFNDKQTRKV